MKCIKCGKEITMVRYGYGWIGLCCCGQLINCGERITNLQNNSNVLYYSQ